jgi:hypothetical protein
MRRLWQAAWLGALLALAGCYTTPMADNPTLVGPGPIAPLTENPILVAPGQPSPAVEAEVFEKVLDVVDDYFEIAYANRYDRRIVGVPRIAPGLEQPWKPGSPDLSERLLATMQTMRHRCFVQIQPAEVGGYYVHVMVLKELLDDPRPTIPMTGSTAFRDAGTVERTFEVVDPTLPPVIGERWIPKGRDCALEQAILKKIQRCQ